MIGDLDSNTVGKIFSELTGLRAGVQSINQKLDLSLANMEGKIKGHVELFEKDLEAVKASTFAEIQRQEAKNALTMAELKTIVRDAAEEMRRNKQSIADLYEKDREREKHLVRLERDLGEKIEKAKDAMIEQIGEIKDASGKLAKRILWSFAGIAGTGFLTWVGSLIIKEIGK